MGRRKSRKKKIEQVLITGIADKGRGVGRAPSGEVVFVDNVVPGDVADVLILRKKKGVGIGIPLEFHKRSEKRIEPFCKHFEYCGGCKWQNLSYEEQLKEKETVVQDALHRIGKVEVGTWLPIFPAPDTRFFRNKLEFGCSPKRWLTKEQMDAGVEKFAPAIGFHPSGAFDKIIDIYECHLQPEPSNTLRNTIREISIEQNIEFYDARIHEGYLRQVMFRITSTGEVMVVVAFARKRPEQQEAFLQALKERMGEQIDTIVYCINDKMNDFMYDLDMHVWSGKGFVHETLGDLKFKIGPKSFFQTNSKQAKNLYDVVLEFADLKGIENVYDLYTGTGSIALYMARHCKQVVGIEEIKEAIDDAHVNANLNNIENATFYAGDVKAILSPEFREKHGAPDLIVTDPPRAGMHPKAVQLLLDLDAPRIVYVSCNPATQGRDLALLSERYKVVKARPVDMFPHTSHVENVVLLEKHS